MSQFRTPPNTKNHEGEERRVGVELEMAGIEAEDICEAVIACFGGERERESSFISHVRATEVGDFRIELDARILTSRGYLEHLSKLGIEIEAGASRDQLEELMSRIAGLVVPLELVCPPVPFGRLPDLDRLRARLHAAGARGTHASPFYAFGLQLNPEVWDTGIDAILPVLKAFFLQYESLLEIERVDLSRKLTPFVQPFPEDFVARVLNPDYAPDLEGFIDDFLRFTPTRNRPLDLLPLLAWLDEDRVMAAPVERELIKPRPTWHYRLPNCLIDDADWNLSVPWNGWVGVEELAADPERLERLSREWLAGSGGISRWWAAFRRGLMDWLRGR